MGALGFILALGWGEGHLSGFPHHLHASPPRATSCRPSQAPPLRLCPLSPGAAVRQGRPTTAPGGAGDGSASGRRLCSREVCNLNPRKGHLYGSSKSVTFLAVTRSALPSALPPSPGTALPHLHFPSRDGLIFLSNRGRVVEAAYLGLRMPDIYRREHRSQRLHWNSKRTGWRLKEG